MGGVPTVRALISDALSQLRELERLEAELQQARKLQRGSGDEFGQPAIGGASSTEGAQGTPLSNTPRPLGAATAYRAGSLMARFPLTLDQGWMLALRSSEDGSTVRASVQLRANGRVEIAPVDRGPYQVALSSMGQAGVPSKAQGELDSRLFVDPRLLENPFTITVERVPMSEDEAHRSWEFTATDDTAVVEMGRTSTVQVPLDRGSGHMPLVVELLNDGQVLLRPFAGYGITVYPPEQRGRTGRLRRHTQRAAGVARGRAPTRSPAPRMAPGGRHPTLGW
jgi:hypothetical protein